MLAARAPLSLAAVVVVAVLLLSAEPSARADQVLPQPAQGGADWPMYGSSAAHNASSGATPPASLGQVWSYGGRTTASGGSLGSAIVLGSAAFLADADDTGAPAGPHLYVHRLTADNGTADPAQGGWSTRVPVASATLVAPPRSLAADGSQVYALFTVNRTGTNRSQEIVAALDETSGAIRWTFNGTQAFAGGAGNGTTSAIAVDGGLLAFGSQDGSAYALNATGGLLWYAPLGAPVQTVPAIAGRIVYAAAGTTLYFLDRNGTADGTQGTAAGTGDILRTIDAGATIDASPVVSGGYVFVDAGGTIAAYDATFGGAPVWTFASGSANAGTPAAYGDLVIARFSDGRVVALDRQTGAVAWARGGLAPIAGAEDVAAADGRVFLTATDGASFDLVSLDAATGAVVDRNVAGGRPTLGAPIAARDLVIVSMGTNLLGFRGRPDLAVLATDVTMTLGQAQAGVAHGHANIVVRNVGTENAYGVHVMVYDGTPGPDTLIADLVVGNASKPIKPGGRSEGNATADRDWKVGRHEVWVVVDPAAQETDTGNNQAVAIVYVQAGPSGTVVVGAGPYLLAILLGFLLGLVVLVLPIRRLRQLRRKETEPAPPPEPLRP